MNDVMGRVPPMMVRKEFRAWAVKHRKSCNASAGAGWDLVIRVRCFTNLASVDGVTVVESLYGVLTIKLAVL